MPTWPATLPRPGPNNYSEAPQSGLLRSDMEMGPPKVRRRFTATATHLDIRVVMTAAQLSTLESFYTTDCLIGSLPFDYTHPRTNAAVKARFIQPYQFSALGRGYWSVAIPLEVLP